MQTIRNKIINSERLSKEDGLSLYKSYDLTEIGMLADLSRVERLKKAGKENEKDYVYWINNHHLNLTNICEGSCKFCAYRRKKGQEGAFGYSIEDAIDYVETKVSDKAREIHIVSAINPVYNLEYYKKLFAACRRAIPNAHVQALTAVEVDYVAGIEGISVEEVLKELISSGLGSIPGGGAEIFAKDVRDKVCPEKISGKRWLEVMESAHKLGLKSNVTMLTGIGESSEDKIEHMLAVRDLQDRTSGFMSFIPLFCHYENTELTENLLTGPPTGIEMLKEYAIARLMLDNIPHLKAFRIQTGTRIAQVSLAFGADDIDGTVIEEKITKMAGSKDAYAMKKEEIERLITRAGKVPIERDTLYNHI